MITERHLARAEYLPARIWAFDSSEAIKRAVADGLGVSFMSRLLVEDEIERGRAGPVPHLGSRADGPPDLRGAAERRRAHAAGRRVHGAR